MNPQIGFLLNKSLESLRNSNLESAELYLKQALRMDSRNPHVLRLLGVISAQRRQYPDALKYLNDSLKAFPKNSLALSNLGNVFLGLKEYSNALDAYDKSIRIDPKYEEVWSNKGNALYELKCYEEALAHHDKALLLKPDYAEAWSNKGNTLYELKCYEEALAHHDKALLLKPDYAEAWSNKGMTLHKLMRHEEAIFHYDKALFLKPDIDWIYGELLHTKMKICRWSGFVECLEDISSKVLKNEKVAKPFAFLTLCEDAFLHKKCSETYFHDKYPSNITLGPILKYPKKEKIRIAYFSPDFRNHPVSFLTAEFFEMHDRGRFEIFAFSLQKAPIGDEMNLRLRKGFDRFIDVENMSDLQVAQLARELEIDIAIDLAGPTQDSRAGIFSYRAAPIQVNWLGYPGTFGADFIDYIVADKTTIPESHQQFYTEKVVYLPDTYMVDDSKRIASSRIFTRQECGLPENVFVFCCFNNDYKFNPQVLDSWARILLTVQGSILWISENNQGFRANITAEFEKRGVNSSRIIFARRVELMKDHLARYKLADLFLDTYPYNAHTTAIDSLKAGVPVLTLLGKSFAGRVAASLLNAISLTELVTTNQEDYESLAIELASSTQKLAAIKRKLSQNLLTTPLFDTSLFTRNLESAYIKIYQRGRVDLPLEHIFIS